MGLDTTTSRLRAPRSSPTERRTEEGRADRCEDPHQTTANLILVSGICCCLNSSSSLCFLLQQAHVVMFLPPVSPSDGVKPTAGLLL